MITESAYAKINLSLDIVGLLPNKYHEVRMVMQTLSLCDELTFEKAPEGSGITLTTDSEVLNGEQSQGTDNLIVKAIRLLAEACGRDLDVKVNLKKNIPIAAGMAGGSADGAAALRGVNKLFNLGFSMEELKKIGVKLGADVPFCVEGGLQLSEGIGELLTELPKAPTMYVLTCKPDIFVSTRDVYVAYDAETEVIHPDVSDMVEGIRAGSFERIIKNMGNVLEPVTVKMHPIIKEIEASMLEAGAEASMMSGSGPTVFGLFRDKEAGELALKTISAKYPAYSNNLSTLHYPDEA